MGTPSAPPTPTISSSAGDSLVLADNATAAPLTTLSLSGGATGSWAITDNTGSNKLSLGSPTTGANSVAVNVPVSNGAPAAANAVQVQCTVDGTGAVVTWDGTVQFTASSGAQTYTIGILDTIAGGSRTNVPWMAAVPLKTGAVSGATDSSGNTLSAAIGGSPINIGVGMRCAGKAGKLQFAVVGGVLASLGSGSTASIVVSTTTGSDPSGTGITWADILATGALNAAIEFDIGGTTYLAKPGDAATSDTTWNAANPLHHGTFLDTPYLVGISVSCPIESSGGARANDRLRMLFDVYAWKAGSGAVNGGNPILAVMIRPEVEMASWGGSTFSDPACTACRIKDSGGSTLTTFTGSPTFPLYGYAADNLRQYRGIWWSNTGARRDGWDVIPENVSGKLQKLIDNGHMLPNNFTAANCAGNFSTWQGILPDGTLPFDGEGVHTLYQPGTGPRPGLNVTHSVDGQAMCAWTDANVRQMVHEQFSTALHIPHRYKSSGKLLDITGAHASDTWETQRPASSPGSPFTLDLAHQESGGHLLFLIYGEICYLRHMQFLAQDAWTQNIFGTGLDRRLYHSSQLRGGAWAARSTHLACAYTPNAMSANITGWDRALIQSFIDHAHDPSNTSNSFGFLHGTFAECWDNTGDHIPASLLFDNSDSADARFVPAGSVNVESSFQQYFMGYTLLHGASLDVLDSNGLAFKDWWIEGLCRWMTGPFRDIHIEYYYGRPKSVGTQMTWPERTHYWASQVKPNFGGGEDYMVSPGWLPGLTSFSINAANPAAVVITLNGGSLAYFDDNEQNNGGARGDWFKKTGAYSGYTDAALWVGGNSPNNWAGRVTAVSSDGRQVTINCTVTDGVAPSSSPSNVTLDHLYVPPWGPRSAWIDDNVYVAQGGNDYTAMARGLARTMALMSPPIDLTATIAMLDERYTLRTNYNGSVPPEPGDYIDWDYGAEIS